MPKYPFERMSEDAKRTLVYAQEEAEALGAGYIGTEHFLLAMFRLGEGSAHRALLLLGVDGVRVRNQLESVFGKGPGRSVRLIPTTRVKRVIEIAFDESQRMDKGPRRQRPSSGWPRDRGHGHRGPRAAGLRRQ